MFFWLAVGACVAIVAILAVALAGIALWARLSGELWASDPYIGALDPTLWDTDAHQGHQPDERPAPGRSGLRDTIASQFNFSGASERLNG